MPMNTGTSTKSDIVTESSKHDLTSNDGGCANCGRVIDVPGQKFCPDCGLPTPAHRIDWEFLSHEIQHSILHVDKGILFTIKELLTRPGHMIREYIHGKRGGHIKPFLMIMILGTVVTLLSKFFLGTSLFNSWVNIKKTPTAAELAEVRSEVGFDPMGFVESFTDIGNWMNDHFAISTLLLLPFAALALKLAFRKFRDINYPEWLVIATFLLAQIFVIFGVGLIVRKWFPDARGIFFAISAIANAVTLMQYFQDYPRWKSALRTVLGYVIFFFFNSVIVATIVFTLIGIFKQ